VLGVEVVLGVLEPTLAEGVELLLGVEVLTGFGWRSGIDPAP
jgi:hypothetical protein